MHTFLYSQLHDQRRQSWGSWGGRDPPDFGHGGLVGGGSQGVVDGSWTGLEILLYLIMYRKYVWKWWNRIICPEVAVNEQFLPDFAWKIEFFFKITWKIEIFWKFAWKIEIFENFYGKIETFKKFAWKNRNFSKICLEKLKFIWEIAWKIKISLNFACKIFLLTRIHDLLQISNQIDEAALGRVYCIDRMRWLRTFATVADHRMEFSKWNWKKTMGKDYDKCSKGDKRYIIFKYINAHTYTCRCMHLSKNAYKYNYTLHNYLITLHYLEELLSFSLHSNSNSNLFRSIHLFW